MNVAIIGHHVDNVRDAFTARGHTAFSHPPRVGARLFAAFVTADLLICFPPCKFLCSSGLHWNARRPERVRDTEDALLFVRILMGAEVPRIAIENPVGCISTRIRKPDQFIQPHQFGHDASKKTCLWLKNLPLLQPTAKIEPRWVKDPRTGLEVPRWSNQFDSGQNNLVSSPERATRRAERYQGIADAMADQWGVL